MFDVAQCYKPEYDAGWFKGRYSREDAAEEARLLGLKGWGWMVQAYSA